ncbi:hypothetical protein PUMCH_002324 [Australozyma saopauloensis]|uniref:Transmembrane protein n=1 Tax=Australozyma saopauloensis TaxID=291208 RepID=A0AAX4H906_9ASCO|nr:hypothetical protein PUMCH_002324 [[Candida] saopauloensis]
MSSSSSAQLHSTVANGRSSEAATKTQKPEPTKEVPIEPTNKTVDAEFRKKKLVRKHAGPSKIKYAVWLGGHATCVVFGVIALVWNLLWFKDHYYLSSICYRISLIGEVVALVCTTSRRFGFAHLPRFSMMLAQKNFQYILLSVAWLFTFRSVLKIVPVILISMLQLAENKKIEPLLKLGDMFGTIIAFDELILVAYLFARTVAMIKTSGYQLILMMTLLWLRVLFDAKTAEMFAYVVDRLDGKMSQVQNKKVRKAWNKLRAFIKEKVEGHGPDNQVDANQKMSKN